MSEPGTLLGGRYELISIIGRGGMAEVWRAHDRRLDREVAVKRLRIDLASDPAFQARFRREAQAAAGLNHPNIVAVYDTGEEADTRSDVHIPYIVMELVEGHTLRDVLRDGRRILPERALEFTSGVLDALGYSHRAGIIHRDIKPANVMLTTTGQVKVMDFGIARAVADTAATMTQTAAVIGTAQYLSPEQARGETVDQRSDLYSAGCLLYELLVGRPPFIGDSPVSVAYQHVREIPVAPSQLDPEITPAMDAVTLKALAKDPGERYQSAREMREDVERLLNGAPVAAQFTPTAVVPEALVPTTAIPAVAGAGVVGAAAAAANPALTATGSQAALVEDVEEPRKKTWIWVVSILGVVLLAILGFGLYQVFGKSSPPPAPPSTPASSSTPSVTPTPMTTVPKLTGLTEDQAKTTLSNAQLKLGKVTKVTGDEQTKGQVTEQSLPQNSSVAQGTAVDLTINSGPQMVKVPAGLVGMNVDDASKKLRSAGLEASTEEVDADDPTIPQGQVLSADPGSGEQVAKDSTVKLRVASGRVKAPYLVGKTVEEATKLAKARGLNLEVVEIPSEQPKGVIVKQSPNPDDPPVSQGSTITVQVSLGPQTPTPDPSPSDSQTPTNPQTSPSSTESP